MVLKTLFLLMFIGANFLVADCTSFEDQLQDMSEDEALITPRTQNFQNRMENGHSIFTSNTKENLKEVPTEEEELDVNQVVHRDYTTIKELDAEYMEERLPTVSTVNSGTITEEEKFEIEGENKSGNLFDHLFRNILIRYIEVLKKELRRRRRNEQIYKQFKKEKDQILTTRTVKREKSAAVIQEFEDKVNLLKLFKITRKKRSSDGMLGGISETLAHEDDSPRLEKMLAEENNQLTDQTVESLDFTENQMEEEMMENADWSLGKETPTEREEARNENASFSTNIRRRKRNAKKDESEEDDSDEDDKAKKKKKNRGKNTDQEAKSEKSKKHKKDADEDDGSKEKPKKKIKEDGKAKKNMDDEELDNKDEISEENIFDDDTADIKEGTDYDEKEIIRRNGNLSNVK